MSSLQQRIVTKADLIAQLRELERLREQVRKELSLRPTRRNRRSAKSQRSLENRP
jgi:hypothetical protein